MNVPVTTDEAVERFSAVLRREEFLAELKRTLPSLGQDEPSRDMSLRMLKPHKNRVTFEMSIKTRGGSQSILCKCHLDNRQDVFDAMQVIYNAGFGAGAEFAIAKPVAYMSSFNTLLEEMVQGTRSSEVFLGENRTSRLELRDVVPRGWRDSIISARNRAKQPTRRISFYSFSGGQT